LAASADSSPLEIEQRTIRTNGLEVHVAEAGQGPLVVLCHGWPECWYSWRHQLPALAQAGYRAVAPDQRGYGRTGRPEPIEAYDIFQLVGDIVGLVAALGEEQAVVVGHDWGSIVASHCALLRPDIFRAVALLSVPYFQRSASGRPPTDVMRFMAGESHFYQLYFQEPGLAEAELEADVRQTMLSVLYGVSGDALPEKRWRLMFDRSETLLDTLSAPESLPGWLTEEDLDVFTAAFERSGFRGGLNWYRNIDRNWELTSFLTGAKVQQPALFVAGNADPVIKLYGRAIESLEKTMPRLHGKVMLEGAGHWLQQERPGRVNELLLAFLDGVGGK
jgi:pimeloyl-ACP methyl ester carboxylesterase